MEVESVGVNSSKKTPIKQLNSSQNDQNSYPILIQDDSPELEISKSRNSGNQNDMRQNMIDEQIDSNTITIQKSEKKLENNLFSSIQHLQFKDFDKNIENLKLFVQNQEKENMFNQNMIESNKQITNRNNNRDTRLMDIISQQKQNDHSQFKDSQIEEFRLKLKQKDMQLQQKEDENRELFNRLKMMEQKLNVQDQDFTELKQVNKKYQQIIDYTSEVNSEWKTQVYEQKSLVEDLQRKVFNLESKSERVQQENQQITEKNMELYNQNTDLKEELEKQKRDYQLLKAQTRQEEGIFDEYGNQQNKFISSLVSYQKDLKDVFDQINNNPIIEKYKKQNDELLIENTNLREEVIKLNQEISEKQLEDIKRNSQDQDKLNEFDMNSNNNALMLYDSMMQKFTEMDERMVQNDNEKFEALQQKDFWFNKQQQFEKENQELKERIKSLSAKNDEYESNQFNNKNNKKGMNQAATNHKTKKRKAGKDSDVEEDNAVIADKKVKPNIEQIDISPQKNLFDAKLTNQSSNASNSIPISLQQQDSLNALASTKSNALSSTSSSLPVKNTGLFQLKVCIKCNLNIKKMQEFETCAQCRKEYHFKCKGESVIGTFCTGCYEKQKKKANTGMEEEKPKESIKQNDMVAEN